MRRLFSLALAIALVGSGLTLASAQAEGPTAPIVTWPQVTQFNPELVDYEIQLADAGGAGELVAWWGYDFAKSAPLPHVGSAVLPFGDEGTIDVVVARCEPGYRRLVDCSEVARSERLTVRTQLGFLTVDMGTFVGLGPAEVRIRNFWRTPIDRYDWEIVEYAQTDQVVATGTEIGPFSQDPRGADVVDIQMPSGAKAGSYRLRVTGIASTPEYGVLTGVGDMSFRYNPIVPTLKVTQNRATFYPQLDGYQDSVALEVIVDQRVALELEVTDSKGAEVYRSTRSADVSFPGLLHWNGTNNRDKWVAPGTYALAIRGVGDGGNQAQWHGKVVVSGKRLVTVTKSFTVKAATSLMPKPYAGKCSKLARRAKAGLGFYSQTKCKGGVRKSMVTAFHWAYLPKAVEGRYRSVQVTLNGGPATGARNNYINVAYWGPKQKALTKVKSLHGKGALRGKTVSARQIFDRTKDRPYLIWWAGLTAGSRFNVTSYKVTTTYQVLR